MRLLVNESNVYAWDSFDITISALGTLALLCIAVFVTVGMWRAFVTPLLDMPRELPFVRAVGLTFAICLSAILLLANCGIFRLIIELWTTS